MHFRIFNSILEVFQLHAVAPPLSLTTKNVSRYCQMSPGEQNHALLRTAAVQTGFDKFSVTGQAVSTVDFVGHTRSVSHLFLP